MLVRMSRFYPLALWSMALPAIGQSPPTAPLKEASRVYIAPFQRTGTDKSDLGSFAQRLFELRLGEMSLLEIAPSSSSPPCGTLQGNLPQSSPVRTESSANFDSALSIANIPPFYVVQGSLDAYNNASGSQLSSLITYNLTYFVHCQPRSVLSNQKSFRPSDALQSLLDAADEVRTALTASIEQRAFVEVGSFEMVGDGTGSFSTTTELMSRIIRQKLAETDDLLSWNGSGPPPSSTTPPYRLTGRITISKRAADSLTVMVDFFVNDEILATTFGRRVVGNSRDDLISLYVDAADAAVKSLSDLHYSERADIDRSGSKSANELIAKANHLLCLEGGVPVPNCSPDPRGALLALDLASRAGGANNPDVLTLIAQAHSALEEFAVAAKTYDRASQVTNPQDPVRRISLLSSAADAWYDAKEYSQAASRYQECLHLSASLPSPQTAQVDLRLRYARSLRLAGNNSEALEVLLNNLNEGHDWPQKDSSFAARYSTTIDELKELIRDLPREDLLTADSKITADLAFDPALEATTLYQIGIRYFAINDFIDAEPLFNKVLHLQEGATGVGQNDMFNTLTYLGLTYSKLSQFDRAQAILARALEVARKIYGSDDRALGEAEYRLANTYYYLSKYDLAEALYTEAFKNSQDSGDVDKQSDILTSRGFAYENIGKYVAAESDLKQALELRRRSSGSNDTRSAGSMINLAYFYLVQERYISAEPLYKEALAIYQSLPGDSSLQVKDTLGQLGRLYVDTGRMQEAATVLARANSITDAGNSDPLLSSAVAADVGLLHYYRGEYHDAEPFDQQALSLARSAKSDNEIGTILNNLGLLYVVQMRYGEAETALSNALELYTHATAAVALNRMSPLKNMAELKRKQGQYLESETLYKEAMKLLDDLSMTKSPDYSVVLNGLGLLYVAEHRYEEAETLCRQALAIREKELGRDHWRVASSVLALGDISLFTGKLDISEQYYRRAIQIWKSAQTPTHPDVATALNGLAKVRSEQNKLDEAERLCLDGLSIRKQVFGSKHRDVADSLATLASIYEDQGKHDKAAPLYEEALSIYTAALGQDNPEVYSMIAAYTPILRKMNRVPEAEALEKHMQEIKEKHPEIKL